jgi:hypothetical protein
MSTSELPAGRQMVPAFAYEHMFAYRGNVTDLPIPELLENRLRSIAMLPPGAPALNRDEALELREQLKAALLELRKLRTP